MKRTNIIYRGDVYYVNRDKNETPQGSEMWAGRPAVVISNNTLNSTSGVLQVAYLTSREKKEEPTHVAVNIQDRKTSTVLCEQIYTVSKKRLGRFVGSLSPEDMMKISSALSVCLELEPSDT